MAAALASQPLAEQRGTARCGPLAKGSHRTPPRPRHRAPTQADVRLHAAPKPAAPRACGSSTSPSSGRPLSIRKGSPRRGIARRGRLRYPLRPQKQPAPRWQPKRSATAHHSPESLRTTTTRRRSTGGGYSGVDSKAGLKIRETRSLPPQRHPENGHTCAFLSHKRAQQDSNLRPAD